MYIFIALIICFGAATFEFLSEGSLAVLIPYGLINPILILTPRFLIKRLLEKKGVTGTGWLVRAEALLLLVILFNALGSLFFHALGFQYDRFLHFMMGFVCVPSAVIYFSVFFRIAGRHASSKNKLLFVTFTSVFVALFAFEGLQFSLDTVFGSNLFSDAVQPIFIDFWEDIFFGFTGALLGTWYSSRIYDRIETEMRG